MHRCVAITQAQGLAGQIAVIERHAGAVGASGSERCGLCIGIDGQRVGEVERDHLGIDEVIAVGAHAGDGQRDRELGVGLHGGNHFFAASVMTVRRPHA